MQFSLPLAGLSRLSFRGFNFCLATWMLTITLVEASSLLRETASLSLMYGTTWTIPPACLIHRIPIGCRWPRSFLRLGCGLLGKLLMWQDAFRSFSFRPVCRY